MGILDDAIKEHLELKKQHGADASELKQLEDEAFGAAERPGDEGSPPPDPLAEAPTEFLTRPGEEEPEAPETESRAEPAPEPEEAPAGRPEPRAEIADLQEAPERQSPTEPPAAPVEEESAMEHEAIPTPPPEPAAEPEAPSEPEPPSGPSAEERQAIAEQPTEVHDVASELDQGVEGKDGDKDTQGAGTEEEDADDFFDEMRLSDELDQALEAPSEPEEEKPAPEPPAEPAEKDDLPSDEGDHEDEDVLEETPDFLEEAPEDDRLWFEQKPPKDFDFDD